MLLKENKGFSLVEGLIGIVIIGLAVTAIFSVILSSFTSDKKTDSKEESTFILQQASDKLKVYIAANDEMPDNMDASLKSGLCGTDKNKKIVDTTPFSKGTHDVSCLLYGTSYSPANSEKNKLTYTVSDPVAGCGVSDASVASLACKDVQFSLETQ
ncbi:MAG: type II secretion system protein [Elusimicrobiaceae bacterium]|jgi:type II secretory pathway pseudopilin PulG